MSWTHEAYFAGITLLVVGSFPEDGDFTDLFIDDDTGHTWTLITEITGASSIGPWSTWQVWWTNHDQGSNTFNPELWGTNNSGMSPVVEPVTQQQLWLVSQDGADSVTETAEAQGGSPLAFSASVSGSMFCCLLMGPQTLDIEVKGLTETSGQRYAKLQGLFGLEGFESGIIVSVYFEMNCTTDLSYDFPSGNAWAVGLELPPTA